MNLVSSICVQHAIMLLTYWSLQLNFEQIMFVPKYANSLYNTKWYRTTILLLNLDMLVEKLFLKRINQNCRQDCLTNTCIHQLKSVIV